MIYLRWQLEIIVTSYCKGLNVQHFRDQSLITGRVGATKRNQVGVGVADDANALVHHIGTATAGVRVPAAATKKGVG